MLSHQQTQNLGVISSAGIWRQSQVLTVCALGLIDNCTAAWIFVLPGTRDPV